MDNEVPEHMLKNMPEPRMAHIQIDDYLKIKAFEIASKNKSFSSTVKISAETRFKKINVYLYGETMVKQTSERNSKSAQYIRLRTDKVWMKRRTKNESMTRVPSCHGDIR